MVLDNPDFHNITSIFSAQWLLPSSDPDHNIGMTIALRLGFGWEKRGGTMPPPSSSVGATPPMITGQRRSFRLPFSLEVAPIYMVSLTTSPNSWP
jgi:hypothetical protein